MERQRGGSAGEEGGKSGESFRDGTKVEVGEGLEGPGAGHEPPELVSVCLGKVVSDGFGSK